MVDEELLSFAGALGTGLIHGVIDAYLGYRRPSIGGIQPLPSDVDFGILGASAAVFLTGHYGKVPALKKVGEGALIWSIPWALKETVVRAASMTAAPAVRYVPAPTFTPTPAPLTPAAPAGRPEIY